MEEEKPENNKEIQYNLQIKLNLGDKITIPTGCKDRRRFNQYREARRV